MWFVRERQMKNFQFDAVDEKIHYEFHGDSLGLVCPYEDVFKRGSEGGSESLELVMLTKHRECFEFNRPEVRQEAQVGEEDASSLAQPIINHTNFGSC